MAIMLVERGVAVKHLHVAPSCRMEDVQSDFLGFVNEADDKRRAGILTGDGPVVREFRSKLTPAYFDDDDRVLIVLFKSRGFMFTKEHRVDPIEPLVTWLEGGVGCCSACFGDVHVYASTCTRCGEKTCMDCFPRIVSGKVPGKGVFECPVCRLTRSAEDAVDMMALPGTLTRNVWGAISAALASRPWSEGTLVIANHTRHVKDPFVVTCRASITVAGKVKLKTRHLEFAREAMMTPGTVVGVGHVSVNGPYKPDPLGRAFFVVDGRGNVREILKGWEYTFACYVAPIGCGI